MRTHQSLGEGKLALGSTVLPCHGDPIRSFPPYGKASPRLPGFIDAVASLGRVINWHADPTLASPHASSDAEKRPRVQGPPRTVDDGDVHTGTTGLKSCNEQSAWEGDFARLDCCLGLCPLACCGSWGRLSGGQDPLLWASPKHACQPTDRGRPQDGPPIAARSIQPPLRPCGSRHRKYKNVKPPFPLLGATPGVTTPKLNHCQPKAAYPPRTPKPNPHQSCATMRR